MPNALEIGVDVVRPGEVRLGACVRRWRCAAVQSALLIRAEVRYKPSSPASGKQQGSENESRRHHRQSTPTCCRRKTIRLLAKESPRVAPRLIAQGDGSTIMEIAGKVVQRPMPRECWDPRPAARRHGQATVSTCRRSCATVHTFFYDEEPSLARRLRRAAERSDRGDSGAPSRPLRGPRHPGLAGAATGGG